MRTSSQDRLVAWRCQVLDLAGVIGPSPNKPDRLSTSDVWNDYPSGEAFAQRPSALSGFLAAQRSEFLSDPQAARRSPRASDRRARSGVGGHYWFYSDTLNLAKAVHFGELAARQSTEVFTYGEAARQLDRALLVQDLIDPDDRAKRCDLLLPLVRHFGPPARPNA
jgi:hypothetical protein